MDVGSEPYGGVSLAMREFTGGVARLRAAVAGSLGLGVSELVALMLLGEVGQLTPKELSLQLGITTGSMTAMTDRLEAAGFWGRGPHPFDGRSILLKLTPAGEDAARHYRNVYEGAIESGYRRNAPRDVAGDAAFLKVVAQALEEKAQQVQKS